MRLVPVLNQKECTTVQTTINILAELFDKTHNTDYEKAGKTLFELLQTSLKYNGSL